MENNLGKLVCTKENIYFGIMLFISILFYLILIISIFGIFYLLIFAIVLFYMQGLAIGNIRQNAVKITGEQFEDVYKKVVELSKKLGLEEIPDVYLMQSGGVLNAFATRFLFRDIVVIYSDILELAYEQGESAVDFVIAHELAHIKRSHLSKRKYIACAMIIPFLGSAYSRACEYTCDRFAASVIDSLPLDGLLVLAAGTKLYKKVNADKFVANAYQERGYWEWLAEIYSSHPGLAARVKNIARMQDAGN